MSDEKLMRLLTLVCRELGAEDARVEIGGQPPADDGRHLWVSLGGQRRLVVVFGEPLAEPEPRQARLAALAEAFSETASAPPPPVRSATPASLDDELAALCVRASACGAVIVDTASPVIWGRSHPELGRPGDRERWLAAARALPHLEALVGSVAAAHETELEQLTEQLRAGGQAEAADGLAQVAAAWRLEPAAFARWARCGKALASLSEQLEGAPPSQVGSLRRMQRGQDGSWYARGLADVYLLVLAFDAPLSEPRVEGVVRRALPHLEKLVAGLPPIEPPPGRRLRLLRPD